MGNYMYLICLDPAEILGKKLILLLDEKQREELAQSAQAPRGAAAEAG